jgi:predicted GIY-YIG superfamily endonuclease
MKNKIVRSISKNPICGIYQIRNKINGKIYIGQSIDIERRWNQHKYGKGSIILRNAIKKYGINNFKFEILVEIEFTNKNEVIKKLTKLEQKWLDSEKPYLKENGYNQNKLSKPNIPIKRPDGYGELISRIKIDNNHCGKPVKQYDLVGDLIKIWKSAAEIERELGFKAENISGCCLGKQYSSNGYIWLFYGVEIDDSRIELANNSRRLSIVRQYDLGGNLINIFDNILDAESKTGIRAGLIRDVCNGSFKTGKGFIWKFKNQPLILLEHLKLRDLPIKQLSLDGVIINHWGNISRICEHFKLTNNSIKQIYSACRNNTPYKGFRWVWDL